MFIKPIAAILALVSLPGCSALSALGDASTPLEVYELRAPAGISPTSGRPAPLELVVEEPTTSGALETDRIMIRPTQLQAQYLPEVRWSEPTPIMVQTLILRSIEATQGVRYVGRRPLGANGDYAILTELTDFQADLEPDGQTAIVQMRLISRVVRESDTRIIGSRVFAASASAPSVETGPLIAAFDLASSRLFADHAKWVLSVVQIR